MVHPKAAKNIASLERDAETRVCGISCFLPSIFWTLDGIDLHPAHAVEKVQFVHQAAAWGSLVHPPIGLLFPKPTSQVQGTSRAMSFAIT